MVPYISLPSEMSQIIWYFWQRNTHINILNHLHYTPYINQLFPSFQANSLSLSPLFTINLFFSSLYFSPSILVHRHPYTISNINKEIYYTLLYNCFFILLRSPFLNQNYACANTQRTTKKTIHKTKRFPGAKRVYFLRPRNIKTIFRHLIFPSARKYKDRGLPINKQQKNANIFLLQSLLQTIFTHAHTMCAQDTALKEKEV